MIKKSLVFFIITLYLKLKSLLWLLKDILLSSYLVLSNPMIAAMACAVEPISLLLAFLLLLFSPSTPTGEPIPAEWPHQFHALLFMNSSGTLQKLDLWYDWPNGRNFNIIQEQLNDVVKYDLEWNNGTSFIYTLDPSKQECQVVHVEVGILRPNWLEGANYLGQQRVDNFLCNVWEKVDFIWYYEDVLTRRPVKWIFYTGKYCVLATINVALFLPITL